MIKKSILIILMILTIFSFSFFVGSGKYPNALADILFEEQADTINAVDKVSDSVVSIITTKDLTYTVFNENTGQITIDSNFSQTSGGSGIIVREDGLIITNKHVISSDEEHSVVLNNGKVYKAEIVSSDPLEDLALIKIEPKNGEKFVSASFANSRNLKVGQTVLTVGYALGKYKNSVAKGIVSGLNRDLVASVPNGSPVLLSNIIQTDAAINSGNSGGALVDLNGEVVGINTAVETIGQGIGFALTSNTVKKSIKSYEKYGKIKRPQLGVRYIMLDPVTAEFVGLPRNEGAWIHSGTDDPSVVPGSPAALAGLMENDIIFEVNAIKVTESLPLVEIISLYEPGQTIGFKVQRGDKVIIVKVTLGSFE